VKVAWASNQAEAEMIESMLNAEGIPCMLQRQRGFDVADFLAAGPRYVLVPGSAEQKAREILAALVSEGAAMTADETEGESHDPRFDAPEFPG
jgi:hypothetical protein